MAGPARKTRSATRLDAPRVPVVRALAVTWKLPALALRRVGDALSKAKRFAFDDEFNGDPVHGVRWPASLLKVSFGESFDQPITDVAWPASLKELAFSRDFTLPDESFEWPASLWKICGKETMYAQIHQRVNTINKQQQGKKSSVAGGVRTSRR
eukprot:g3297.t1